MKILFRKIKNINRPPLITYFLINLLYIMSYFFFAKTLLSLIGIETVIRIILLILFGLWFFVYLLFALATMILKSYKKFIILTVIHLFACISMLFTSVLISKIYFKIENIASQEYTEYTTNLIALKDTKISSNSNLGMIDNNEDIEGHVLANTLKTKEKLDQKIKYYNDYYAMLSALYNHEIDAIFVSSNYTIIFSNEAAYENIEQDTKVLYAYTEKMKTKTISNTNKKLTEPFTVLLMGVDSATNGINSNTAFNGDTLMLITFNPQNLTATMFSIPRDTYVPIACNNNRYHKINSSAAYGTECVIKTIQNLVDIPIDYYVKINFNGAIDLIDTLGGIDVNVERPDYNAYIKQYGENKLCEHNLRDLTDIVCMDTGFQHLNGKQTLAYARNRHGFLSGDLARNQHQQQIVEAVAKKLLNINSFNNFEELLDVIGNNISTNLSTSQILSFYQILKSMLFESLKGNDFITIQKTYLEVYNLPIIVSNLQLAALGYYEGSLKNISDALKINLNLKKEDLIKTFSYNYTETYTSPVIGKGITNGKKEITIPNFVNNSLDSAKTWAEENNITLTTEFTCSNNTPGLIGSQSIHAGTSIRNITKLTLFINQKCNENNEPEDDNNPENNPNNNENNSNNTNDNANNNSNNNDTNIIDNIPGSPTNN